MAAPSPAVAHRRAQVARRLQSYPPDHPRVIEAKQGLAVECLAEHAARVVAEAPALTRDQIDRIATILRGGDAA